MIIREYYIFDRFEMNAVAQSHWEILIDHEDYEISNEYPHQIRKISNGRIVSESVRDGYIRVCLNRKSYQKHVLIAKQFIENPDPERCAVVDHINHNRTDNRIDNLRWVSVRMNLNTRSDQELVDDISDEAIAVNSYNDWTFEELYFHDNVFYIYNGISYVVKRKYQTKSGNWYIAMADTRGVVRKIYYSRFKKQYDLI